MKLNGVALRFSAKFNHDFLHGWELCSVERFIIVVSGKFVVKILLNFSVRVGEVKFNLVILPYKF